MPRELIERSTRGARLAAVVAAALATGVVVGVSSLGPGVAELRTVAGGGSSASTEASPEGRALGQQKAADNQKATGNHKTDKSDRPRHPKADADDGQPGRSAAGAGGVHGQCVSAVARDKNAVGGPHDNHGWAVSRAAHTCAHPAPAASGGN